MPLGFQRLNERSQRPNANINFIKPLQSSSPNDRKIAKDFLERIAAQCYPVMKKEYVSVMSLEEYPPNPEFLGRNFNAGEVIQLVLKDKAGRWLSFKFVQMVMMHELAHCKQMNHSRFFWKVRNQYADHMKELWGKKYTGEGLWGRGQDMSGNFVHDHMPDNAEIPEHLCGGTYRTGRGRKRKRGQNGTEKPKLTYAERQQKRIARKFGSHGEGHGLGEDELVRGALEQGQRRYGKPKVANSKRGRELRANAALARFDAEKTRANEREEDDGSETESSEDEDPDADGLATLERIQDQRGRDLYKVCGDEGEQDDEGGQNEMDELRRMESFPDKQRRDQTGTLPSVHTNGTPTAVARTHEDSETEGEPDDDPPRPPALKNIASSKSDQPSASKESNTNTLTGEGNHSKRRKTLSPAAESKPTSAEPSMSASASSAVLACSICSLENEPDSPTCIACSNVLKPSLIPNHWRCKSAQCRASKYINAGDAGRCGLCGSQKPVAQPTAMGVTSSDVLRWD